MAFWPSSFSPRKSVRWDPSLKEDAVAEAEIAAAVAQQRHGACDDESAASSDSSGMTVFTYPTSRRARFASLSAGLAVFAIVAMSSSSAGGAGDSLSAYLPAAFRSTPMFDPEGRVARSLKAKERKVRKEVKAEEANDRQLQLSGFGAESDANGSPNDEERYMNEVFTGYDTTVTSLPAHYDNFKNVWDLVVAQDQPLLWYVPKAGGNTIGKVLSHCLDLVTASSVASTVTGGLDPPTTLVIHTHPDGARYVNVDPSTVEGLQKAADGGLAATNSAAVVITQRLESSKILFSNTNQARAFVMLRHPIKRVVDQFYYRQWATWESGYDSALATMSLEEFAASDRLVENFVVRSLIHKVDTAVTSADVQLAKDVLRQKFLVGIFEQFDLSVVRFEKYFGWWDSKNVLTDTTVNHCHYDRILTGGHVGAHPKAEPGSEAYSKIAVRNWADLELYFYAKDLFYKQRALLS